MKRGKSFNTFLIVFMSLLIFMLLTHSAYGFNLWSYHWRESRVGLDYDHLSYEWRKVVYKSRMTWNNVGAGIYITYDPSSQNTVTVSNYGKTDRVGAALVQSKSGGWFKEVDIRVNTYYSVAPSTSSSSQHDGQSVVTHELGHLLGLYDTSYYLATMYSYIKPGKTYMRDLDPDDSSGLFSLYPPLHRLYNEVAHFYTTNPLELDALLKLGWRYEGIACWTWGYNFDGSTTPLYRLYNGVDHFYTTSASERDALIRQGWRYEGLATYVLIYYTPGVTPLYRLYNGVEHFYTANIFERDALIRQGWRYEGLAAYVRYR